MIQETSEQIRKRFLELNAEIESQEIERRIRDLVERFKVPAAEAERSVVSYFLREHNIKREDYYGTPEGAAPMQISDINQTEQWVNLRAKVTQLWESTSPAISQVGLIGDETGTIKFVKWTKSNLQELVEGKSYSLENMTTDEWQGRFSVKMNRTTRISELDEEIGTQDMEAQLIEIDNINESGKWINLRAKVTQLWDSEHESIDQVGLIGDETGTIKFVKWARSELPPIAEGKSYSFENLVTDEFEERFSVKFNKSSSITELDEEIVTPDMEAQLIEIDNINESGKWINLRAKVTQLWDSEHDSIDQVGVVGDETGTIKFVKWAKSELPPLEEGKSYSFENLVTDEYEGRFSVKFNRSSSIEGLDEDIEVGYATAEFTGAMVHIQDGSGLIRRCPICNRALIKGTCMEHGNVEGTHDLRIKAVMDNGHEVQEALFNREITENVSGITLDEAKEMAVDALDHSVVLDEMKKRLLGRYYTMTGSVLDRYLLVESVQLLEAIPASAIDSMLQEVT